MTPLQQAVKEYDEAQSVSALEIANKYGIEVKDIHRLYNEHKDKLKYKDV